MPYLVYPIFMLFQGSISSMSCRGAPRAFMEKYN
ncbi:hypothetical protein AL714_01105 [Clostridium botulinum]|uniref:Uncharacterized protein n=1 Tax=Clostridium botulinum (strain Kyoto / Type A2) TaxID=536232 RepID=C1FR30_CLOBJ|nr:hypothetical protein CLB_2195 [Clostridium botulinum A str. ATCC 19397]ABS37454.1 hypothetical protein CLC_2178 [Clostridium botulinum A str. Hall]ACO84639.1 hypothetical protein CLM_2462 [Clostridium botulinum A2 str. Kyoto]KON10824.1 hypothetical protein ACP52_01605 [Clostridium botulinum]KOR54551.1 hypothetical protein ADT23_01080 [Clostridium botulinum]